MPKQQRRVRRDGLEDGWGKAVGSENKLQVRLGNKSGLGIADKKRLVRHCGTISDGGRLVSDFADGAIGRLFYSIMRMKGGRGGEGDECGEGKKGHPCLRRF